MCFGEVLTIDCYVLFTCTKPGNNLLSLLIVMMHLMLDMFFITQGKVLD